MWENGRQLARMQSANVDAKFVYNESGLRVQKIVNGVVTDYVLHGKNVVHMTRGSDELHFFYDAQNRPAVVVYNGAAYAFVKNLQGDVIAILDGAGNVVASYVYDAWGMPIGKSGTLASTLGTVQPFRYRGYVFDEETGLYYLRSRYYNLLFCRFVNADAGFYGCNNLFSNDIFTYCINNPLLYCDKNGNEAVIPLGENYFPTEVFTNVIRPRIMSYLQNKDDYYYDKTGFRFAEYNDDGTLKKKGYSDCSHLMYELCGKVGSYTARFRYEGYKGPKGVLFVKDSNYNEFSL